VGVEKVTTMKPPWFAINGPTASAPRVRSDLWNWELASFTPRFLPLANHHETTVDTRLDFVGRDGRDGKADHVQILCGGILFFRRDAIPTGVDPFHRGRSKTHLMRLDVRSEGVAAQQAHWLEKVLAEKHERKRNTRIESNRRTRTLRNCTESRG
jgi:hypothetical protein